MVLGNGDISPCPQVAYVRVTLNAAEGIGGGIVGNSPRSGRMPVLKKRPW